MNDKDFAMFQTYRSELQNIYENGEETVLNELGIFAQKDVQQVEPIAIMANNKSKSYSEKEKAKTYLVERLTNLLGQFPVEGSTPINAVLTRMEEMESSPTLEIGVQKRQEIYRNQVAGHREIVNGQVPEGPINLSDRGKLEMKYWVYNESPITVYRQSDVGVKEIIEQGGMHSRAFNFEGLEYHLKGINKVEKSGAISTTENEASASHLYAREADKQKSDTYLYRINLKAKQGLNMAETLKKKYENEKPMLLGYKSDKQEELKIANIEKEITVLGSIGIDQIEVYDIKEKGYISIDRWKELYGNKNSS